MNLSGDAQTNPISYLLRRRTTSNASKSSINNVTKKKQNNGNILIPKLNELIILLSFIR